MIPRALLAAAMAPVVLCQVHPGEDAGMKPPRIEFVGVAPEFIGEDHVRLAFKAVNPNDAPLPYAGYLATGFRPPLKEGVIAPFYDIEYRRDGTWKAEPIGWCGTGAGPVELPRNGSATFYVSVPKAGWEAMKVAVNWY
ncbi:MAG TPA: hypothetical protein VFV87_08710, partial [Pirellulaceae bacterium]|nr:hypothetical protein [Pirellulaceae bacterium]